MVFERFSPEGLAPSTLLARGWTNLALRWSDSLQHERFQQLAVEQGELRAAGRLYAIWLAYLPTDPWGLKGKAELELLITIAAAVQQQQQTLPWLSTRVAVGLASLALLGGTILARLT